MSIRVSMTPNGNNTSGVKVIPPTTDWQALSKTLMIEAAFAGTMAAILTGHGTPDIVSLAWALGGTLGVLRITDIAANAFNVRSYLNAPQAQTNGVMPQAANTPLVTSASTPS